MSAFLGPIHFWLYDKIKIQNNIVEDVLALSDNEDLKKNLYEKYGDGNLKPLDEVVDVGNIHGWLQEQISRVEAKLAVAVTELLAKTPDSIEEVKDIFFKNGEKYSPLDMNSGTEEAMKAVNDTLLDGMPCDHVNSVISQDESEAVWKRHECVHSKYWSDAKGDIDTYYMLRDEFIKGLLEKSGMKYEKLSNDIYKISRS